MARKPNRVVPSRVQPSHVQPSHVKPSHVQPSHVEPHYVKSTEEMRIAVARFEVTHSFNPPRPFCEYGIVYTDGRKFYLALHFVSGKSFIYPNESYGSPEEVIASMQKYQSASWATSPNGPEYDPGRFGPGTYKVIG